MFIAVTRDNLITEPETCFFVLVSASAGVEFFSFDSSTFFSLLGALDSDCFLEPAASRGRGGGGKKVSVASCMPGIWAGGGVGF